MGGRHFCVPRSHSVNALGPPNLCRKEFRHGTLRTCATRAIARCACRSPSRITWGGCCRRRGQNDGGQALLRAAFTLCERSWTSEFVSKGVSTRHVENVRHPGYRALRVPIAFAD